MASNAPASGDFEVELTIPELSFARLVWSDYRVATHEPEEVESRLRALLLFPLRLLINPSIQFAFLVRIAQKGPRLVQYPVRLLQVLLFSCEIYCFTGDGAIEIGPGIAFPHPYGITIGPGTKIGTGVSVYNFTNIGADRHWSRGTGEDDVFGRAAVLGDRCVIYAYSAVQGPWRIGNDAVVGLHVIVDTDVPPGGLLTHKRLRVRGDWPGEVHRTHWPGAGGPQVIAATEPEPTSDRPEPRSTPGAG